MRSLAILSGIFFFFTGTPHFAFANSCADRILEQASLHGKVEQVPFIRKILERPSVFERWMKNPRVKYFLSYLEARLELEATDPRVEIPYRELNRWLRTSPTFLFFRNGPVEVRFRFIELAPNDLRDREAMNLAMGQFLFAMAVWISHQPADVIVKVRTIENPDLIEIFKRIGFTFSNVAEDVSMIRKFEKSRGPLEELVAD